MNKKDNIQAKDILQLSFSFPACKTTYELKIGGNHDTTSKVNTPVININRKSSLSQKAKSDYINLVLNHTKSF